MAHRLLAHPSRALSGPAAARLMLGVLGVCALGAGPLSAAASAQSTQICASRSTGGFGGAFMRMPDSNSCVTVGGANAKGFQEGTTADVGDSLGASAAPLSASALSGSAPVTASPLTSLSTATPSTAPAVDPWKQAR